MNMPGGMSPADDKGANMNRLDRNITIGTTAAGSVWTAYADRHTVEDVATMAARIVKFGGTVSAEARAVLGQDEPAPPAKRITVVLTTAQVDLLEYLLPVDLLGMEFMATRIKGTPCDLRDALDYVDVDEAVCRALEGSMAETDEELAMVERNARISVKAVRRKLRRAIA